MALINIDADAQLMGAAGSSLATSAAVVWEPDFDPEELARVLQQQVADVLVLSPKAAQEILDQAVLVINLVIWGMQQQWR